MKNIQNIADLIVISSYPPKSTVYKGQTVAVASYTKNTLLYILSYAKGLKRNPRIVVLAELLDSVKENHYIDSGVEVRRVWKQNSLSTLFILLKEIIQLRKTRKIVIMFEYAMFGRYLYLCFIPFLTILLKFLRKEVFFVSHQALEDIETMSGHIGLENGSLKADMINLLMYLYNKLIFEFVSKIIVFERELKERLARFTDKKKIAVISHGVDKFDKKPTYQEARKSLDINNEFVILYFGFIAWYKGADWLVEKLSSISGQLSVRRIKVIIAGGANPNHKDKKFYMDYVGNIINKAKLTDGNIITTGFVDEKNIPLYFSACDLVILPYRTFMSSSGPLSLALSFEKPFIISENIKNIGKTDDFQEALTESNLNIDDLTFNLTDNSLEKKLGRIVNNKTRIAELTMFSKALKDKRRFELVGKEYFHEIFYD